MLDPSIVLGTWKLKNVQVTSQVSFPLPQQATSAFAPHEDGLEYTSDVVYPDGRTNRVTSVFRTDGQEYALRGSPAGDAWSINQTSPTTFEGNITRDGKLSGRIRATISDKDNLLTTEWEIVQPEGPTIFYITQAERQH